MFDLSNADQSQRLFGKLSLAAICAACIAVTGWPVVGLLLGEDARGNIAYGLIVGSILIDAALLLGLGTTITTQRALKACWIIFAALACGFSIYLASLSDPEAYKAADTVLLVAMGILAFPMSIGAFVLIYFYSSLFLATSQTSATDIVVFWLLLFVAGYAQWFQAIPLLLRRLEARRLKGANGA
jgi:small-conductance mechanosensitive channel